MTRSNEQVTFGQALYDRIWSMGVRVRDAGKRAGISGPFEPILGYVAPRLMKPPDRETQIQLATGELLWIPPRFPSYRNYALGLYERDLGALIRQLIEPGMTVVDVGANVGFYTVQLSQLVGPNGRVFAFEPERIVFDYLNRNIELNACQNTTAVNAAVSNANDQVGFVDDHLERGFVIVGNHEGDETTKVASVTLDTFFEGLGWPPVDFIKFDIEGGEGRALLGMAELNERNPRLRIVMEYNWYALRRAGGSREQLAHQIEQMGFCRGWIIERRLEPLQREITLPRDRALCNLLLSKEADDP
jgi:FkbM family methyltransferase